MSLPGWLREVEERAEAATPNPELMRYDHGGGRSALLGDPRKGEERKLVADYYNEADREFYHNARTDVPRLLALVRQMGEALEYADSVPKRMITVMRENEIKIDNLNDPMQKLNFTFYSELVEIKKRGEEALHAYRHGPEVGEVG